VIGEVGAAGGGVVLLAGASSSASERLRFDPTCSGDDGGEGDKVEVENEPGDDGGGDDGES